MENEQTNLAPKLPDQILIERITYLASLVSNLQAVDSKLDTLRVITARVGAGNQISLGESERSQLLVLENDLKNYLVTSDPVRSFTAEKLQRRLEKYTETRNPQARAAKIALRQFLAIFGLSFVAYGIGLAVLPGPLNIRFQLASPFFLIALHAGLAWLFWSSRKEFVTALRTAYGYICIGLMISSLGSVQFPLLFAHPALTDMPIFKYAGFMPPFQFMCSFFYIGLYIYARQIQEIRLRFLKPLWVVSGAVLIASAVIVLPDVANVPEKPFFDISLVSTVLSVYFSVPAAVLGFAIVRHLTARYTRALRVFASAQLAVAAACVLFSIVLYIKGPIHGATVALASLPFGVSEVLMLASGYMLKKSVSE